MEKRIIVVKPKTLSSTDKQKLTKDGNIVIEHPSPVDIVYKSVNESAQRYAYTLCCNCGERIYMLEERMSVLKQYKGSFYCSQGHSQSYK